MRGGKGVVIEIGKRLLLERVKGVAFVGGVGGVERGDDFSIRDRVVSTWGGSCGWSTVGIPVPCERRKAADVYPAFVVLVKVRTVGGGVVILIHNSWDGSL